jgi:hypothetical protein
LERLVEDTNNPEHILMLLHAYLANHHEASNITLIRKALSEVKQSAKHNGLISRVIHYRGYQSNACLLND